jgi:hypothetical protein
MISPRGNEGGGFVDDTYDGFLLLFGGGEEPPDPYSAASWSFTSGAWTLLNPASSPPAEWTFGMAYAPPGNCVVLNGGYDPALTPVGTWTY